MCLFSDDDRDGNAEDGRFLVMLYDNDDDDDVWLWSVFVAPPVAV